MRILSILAGALFFTSCVVGTEIIEPEIPPVTPVGMAEVSFEAEMPTPKGVATRAIFESTPENRIEDVYVLVFEDKAANDYTGKLVYKGLGKGLAAADNSTTSKFTFNATLPVGTMYDFLVLANTGTLLADINVTDTPTPTKQDVMDLTKALTATNQPWKAEWTDGTKTARKMDVIPMWGELNNQNLTTTQAVKFSLLRMMARVNVGTNSTAYSTFRMSSVRVYNYSTKGAVIPAHDKYTTDTTADPVMVTATATTQPDGGYAVPTVADPRTALVYGSDFITTDVTTESEILKDFIYLFEAPHNGSTYSAAGNAWIDNPCLVIGGRFDKDGDGNFTEETDTYYRVDFVKKTTGSPDQWLSVLRNYSYNVTITDVSGEGFLTPDEALKSAPFGITANTLAWDERYTQNIVFDGVFYLSVDRDEFTFQRIGVSTKDTERFTNVVKIRTDYLVNKDKTDAASGWKATIEYTSPTNGQDNWLTVNPAAKPSGWNPGDVNEVYFTTLTNPGPNDRTATVWISAGRLKYPIYITQKIMSLNVLHHDESFITDNTFSFVIPTSSTWPAGTPSHTPDPEDFMVQWSPPGRSVKITGQNWANGAFEPEWITGGTSFPAPRAYGVASTPAFSTILGQSGPVGQEEYFVEPETVTRAMLDADPFYEKNTTYYFELTNAAGTETIVDSINLRSIHYDIKADTQKYRLDGGVHTLTVRSNANWEIVSVDEHLFNSQTPTPRPPGSDPIMINFGYAYDNLKEGLEFGPNVNGTALSFHVVNNEASPNEGKWGYVKVGLKMTTPQGVVKTIYVDMMFPPATKLIMGLGYGLDVRSNNIAFGTPYHLHSAFRMLSSPYNFGSMDESVYQVDGLRILGYHANGTSSATQDAIYEDFDWWRNSLVTWLNNDAPDVIVSSTFQTSEVIYNENECRLFKEYLENGGALIMMYNAGSGGQAHVARFMNAIFGGNYSSSANGSGSTAANTDVKNWNTSPATGAVYELASGDGFDGDPILDGPFGDIRGLHWGSHYYRSGIKTSLIEDKSITLSTAREVQTGSGSDEYSIIFRHKDYNLLFIGQDAFTSSYMEYYETREQNHDPFKTDVNNYYFPIGRPHFRQSGSGPEYTVYNSVLLANAIAWALTVTNHQPPVGGYQNQ